MEAVDVALVLPADSSGSVTNEDLALQLRSYAEATASGVFVRTVRSSRYGGIATTLVLGPDPVPGFSSISGANGLPIVRSELGTAGYCSRNVIGDDSTLFTIAMDVTSFHTAIPEDFVTEIAPVGAQSRSG